MMDFIELTPCGKQKHCLVMVNMWSKWGSPRKISSDNGRHFVNDAIKQVGQFLGIDMRTHCSYAPSSGGAVERQNQTIKNKLAKCCEETGLTWLKALPIVLMYMRMRKRVKTNLSPFEILFGRPPFMGIEGGKQGLPSTDVCENDMLNYCKEVSCLLSNISVQVKAAQGKVAERFLHEVRPGDFVVIRDHRRKSWKSKRCFWWRTRQWRLQRGLRGFTWTMKEGAAHCGGGAIAGGGSTGVSVNAKIQFEKPLHCSCVFRRNQISAARRRQLWLRKRHLGEPCNQQNR